MNAEGFTLGRFLSNETKDIALILVETGYAAIVVLH